MTAQLAPEPIAKFFSNDGFPLSLGQLFTYAAGTTTPQATYVDSTQTTQNTNPIQLNFRGECNLWLDPTKTYKFLLKDLFGNTIPGWPVDNISIGNANPSFNVIPTVDNLYTLGSASFSWANIYIGPNHALILDSVSGNIGYYARTAAEVTVSVTPTNFSFQVGDVRRYGADPTGISDSTTAINYAIAVMAQTALSGTLGGGPATVNFPPGVFNISSSIIAASYVTLIGQYGETTLFGAPSNAGTHILWTGANTSTYMLRVFNVRLFKMNGFVLDAGLSNTLVNGILFDSNNNPSGSQNEYERVAIRNCLQGVQWGTSGISPGYANDGRFVNCTIWSTVANSNGITINSGNAGDQSLIDYVGIQVENMGIYIQAASILTIRRCFGGTNLTGGFIVASTAIGVCIEGCSSEGWGGNPAQFRSTNSNFLTVNPPQSNFSINNFTITLINNQINNPVVVNPMNGITTITFTGAPSGTSGTLTSNWTLSTGSYTVTFSDNEIRQVTLTNGATTATWSGALSGSPTTTASVTQNLTRLVSIGDNWGQCAQLVTLTFTAAPTGTSATLTSNWLLSSGAYTVYFSDGEIRSVTLTQGATTATWSGALTGSPTTTATVTSNIVPAYGSFISGNSSLIEINNGVNPGSIDITTGPFSNTPTQGWQDSAFVNICRDDPWLGIFVPSLNFGVVFGGNGSMTWTVSSGNVVTFGYTLRNRIMTIYLHLDNTTIGGTLNTDLTILIPASKVSSTTVFNACVVQNNGVQTGGFLAAPAGSNLLRVRLLAGGNWTASAANAGVQGQISFEVN